LRKELYGYIAVIAAAALWGIGGPAAKFLFNQAVSPFLLVKIRLTLAWLLMMAGVLVYDRRLLYLPRGEIVYFACLGIGGMAMIQFTYLYTISLTNVATAVFLQYLSPVFMAAYAFIWEKARFGWRGGGAVALAMLGGLLIMLSGGGGAVSGLGIASGLVSALVMAFNTIYGRRAVREYHPVTAVTYAFGFGALLWWVITPYGWEPGTITAEHWWMFLYIAVFSTVLPFLLYFVGMRFLQPTYVGVTACLEPVVAASVAYVALGETMGWLQMAGGLLVVIAVVLLQTGTGDDAAAVNETERGSGERV
jgi:drug/metabolite transporter (DMT)-like permease